MLAALPQNLVAGARVLEIGGGVGALQAELLRGGASRGEVVELVSAYRPFALQLAAGAGVADRSSFRVADLLSDPSAIDNADIVILNRVVCCSADGIELTVASAGLASGMLVLSFPRATLIARWLARAQQALFKLLGRRFRIFVRPAAEVRAAAESAGLRLSAHQRGLVWEFMAFQR